MLHNPPGEASVRADVDPTQITVGPDTGTGKGLTVKIAEAIQPVDSM